MRWVKKAVTAGLLCLCLAGCQREAVIDPVLFCRDFNARSGEAQLREQDAYLRGEGEVVLFADAGLVRLQTDENGAVHTAVVTGNRSDALYRFAADAFSVLAKPLSEDVPQAFRDALVREDRSVQSVETKRFQYYIYASDGIVTAVQSNRLSVSLPVLPSLRPE